METDPAIDEIREVRQKISADYGHDARRLVAHYMELERELVAQGGYNFRQSYPNTASENLVLRDKPAS